MQQAKVLNIHKNSDTDRRVEHGILMVLIGFVVLVVASEAMAGNTGMPWETVLDKVTNSLTGPIAKAVGLITVALAAAGMAFGDGGGFKKAMGVLFGLSILFSANAFILQLGYAGGALF